jgi:tetratricopeptide (TPR) repeat protein
VEAYDFSIAINPDYASAYFNKASVWISAGKYHRAIAAYRELLEIEPENTQAFCYMGDCYEQMDHFMEALESFKRVIEIDNTDPEGWFGAGMIYQRQGKHQEAITYILKAIEFDNNNLDYWINLGYANEDAGLMEEAMKCYGYVTRKDAGDLDGWNALTGLLMKEAVYDQALVFLREAYTHHQKEPLVLVRLAVCHLQMENPKLADKFLREALDKDRSMVEEFELYFPGGTGIRAIDKYIKSIK